MLITQNLKNFEKVLIFFWFFCLLSINATTEHFDRFFLVESSLTIFDYFNFIRFLAPFLILPVLSVYYFINLNFNKGTNLFFLFFSLNFLWQILIFILTTRNLKQIDLFQLIASSLSTILIIELFENKKIKILFYIILFYVSLICLYLTFPLLKEFFFDYSKAYLYQTETLEPNKEIFNQPIPRITGLGRMYLLLLFLFFFIKEKLSGIKKYLICVILFLLNIIIYSLQSRGVFIGWFTLLFYYFFNFDDKLSKKVITTLILFILPIISYECIKFYKSYDYVNDEYKKNYDLTNKNEPDKLGYFFQKFKGQYKISILDNRIIYKSNTSSGRINLWKNSIEIIKEKKIIFGRGPQADRRLIFEYINQSNPGSYIENNSSNAMIYSYLCGGIFSAILLIMIYSMIYKVLYRNIFNNKSSLIKDPFINFSIVTLIYLTLRSIFENGYSVFGFDYCLCLLCYYFLFKVNVQKNIKTIN
jgi:hypothetical protein